MKQQNCTCTWPLVKWVGGKSRNLKSLLKFLPRNLPQVYVEPFVGSGAVYFTLASLFKSSIINDINPELINTYQEVRDNFDEVIAHLNECIYDLNFYLKMRNLDREPGLDKLTSLQRCVRFIALSRTCFNGLYRVNKKGYFNVPFGKYVNPVICDEERLRSCSKFLQLNKTEILSVDYTSLLDKIGPDSFVYIDPPYAPISDTSYFTSYQQQIWDDKEQKRLLEFCDALDKKGVRFMASNSTAHLIFDLYRHYNINTLNALRSINAQGDRNTLKEVVITNYDDFIETIPAIKQRPSYAQGSQQEQIVYTKEESDLAFSRAFGEELAKVAKLPKLRKVKK